VEMIVDSLLNAYSGFFFFFVNIVLFPRFFNLL
jgi:hypothetical protein